MKTKTFSILFALVMILSLSVGVFAQDFDETWDENTVLTVFNDIDMVFPDLFADIDSNFLWAFRQLEAVYLKLHGSPLRSEFNFTWFEMNWVTGARPARERTTENSTKPPEDSGGISSGEL